MKVKHVSSTEDETSILPPGLARFRTQYAKTKACWLDRTSPYIEGAVAGGAANIPDGASKSSHSSDLGTVLRRDCG